MGVEILAVYVPGGHGYEAAFANFRQAGAEALLISSSPIFSNDAARLAALALEAGLPTMCEWRDMAAQGCVLAYGVDRAALRRRTADYIARILRGTPAGELPIETPATFELAVNLRAARSLGVAISASLLAQADEVVE